MKSHRKSEITSDSFDEKETDLMRNCTRTKEMAKRPIGLLKKTLHIIDRYRLITGDSFF